MKALWTSEEIASACHGAISGTWDVDGICIDSRTVALGDLFIALKGPTYDGHDFFVEALERGASAAMVTRIPKSAEQLVNSERLVIVEDTYRELATLANASRARTEAQVCAVTGSVGKTTTKEALALTLGRQGLVHSTIGNLNNHVGAPLSVARMPKNTDFGVFELGMSHAGELTPLSRLVRPHVAVITAIEAVHMEFFESIADIANAKAEIFAGLQSNGTAILPADSPHYERLSEVAKASGAKTVVGFGSHKRAAYRLTDWSITETGTYVSADIDGRHIAYEIGLRGEHMALNSLAVLAAVTALGGNADKAANDLSHMTPLKGRGCINLVNLPTGSFVLIDESYNASPISITALVSTLSATPRTGRLILALGDMLELGQDTNTLHSDLAIPIESGGIDLVLTTGSNMAHLNRVLSTNVEKYHTANSEALADLIISVVRAGDIVAVKGSLGSCMNVVVNALNGLATANNNNVPDNGLEMERTAQ
ncbi:MAG: UDP-N-acetylmuramoyl-tripeptide--D-alanyl-D-alanine ligase [Rhodospirillaceae bacterium]